MAMDTTQEYNLEMMLDNSTLADMLQSLESICYAKADHLDSNWQDREAAKAWNRAGSVLSRVDRKGAIQDVS